MSDQIIGIIISGIGSIIVAIIGLIGVIVKFNTESAKREQRQNDRLDVIEKKIDLHNQYGKKFGSCDKNIALMRKDYKLLKNEVKSINLEIKSLRRLHETQN